MPTRDRIIILTYQREFLQLRGDPNFIPGGTGYIAVAPISPEILSLRILHCLQVPLRVEPREMRGKVSDLKATEINAVAYKRIWKQETYEGNLFVDKRLYDFIDVPRFRRPEDRP